MSSEGLREQLRELALELDDIADSLYSTNLLRGRQLKRCVGKLNSALLAALGAGEGQSQP